jgi:hypothetical protein
MEMDKRNMRSKSLLLLSTKHMAWAFSFTLEDGVEVIFPHEDALVILTILSNHYVYRVLADYNSAINILSSDVMAQIRIHKLLSLGSQV